MKRMLLLLSMCLLVAVATATIRHVPGQYPTIQAGINAASVGDTVLVAPGIYTENVQMHEGVSLFGSGMDKTIVDGGGLTNVIQSLYGVLNVVISDLSARNSQQSGSNPGSTGIFLNPNSSSGTKVVRRCHVYNCGFGIEIWNDFGGTAYIEDNVVNNNLYDGFFPYLGTVYLRNNTIVNNGRDCYNDWSGGGLVYMPTMPATVSTSTGTRRCSSPTTTSGTTLRALTTRATAVLLSLLHRSRVREKSPPTRCS
jgi:hypothetical protein